MFISFNGGHGGVWCLHAKIYKFIVYYIDDSAGRLRDRLLLASRIFGELVNW